MGLSNKSSAKTILSDDALKALSSDAFERNAKFVAVLTLPGYEIIYLNDKANQILQASGVTYPKGLLNKSLWIAFPKETDLLEALIEVCSSREARIYTNEHSGDSLFQNAIIIPHIDMLNDEIDIITVIAKDMTEEKQEEGMIKYEPEWRAIFYHAGLGMVQVNLNGFIIRCNPAFETFIGFTSEELHGMSTSQITHADDFETEQAIFRKAIDEKRNSVSFEKRYIHKDGFMLWGQFVCTIIERDGKPEYIIGMVEDITKRKTAEESLRRSENFLRLASQAGNVGAFRWEIPSGDVWWSAQSYAIHGLTDSDFDGTIDMMAVQVHPDDLKRVAQYTKIRFIHREQQYCIPYRIVRPSGEVRWVESRGIITYGTDESPSKVIGVYVDITQRIEAEATLRKANERLTNTLNNITDAYVAFDYEGRFLEINRVAEQKLYQRAADELMGKVSWEEYPNIVDTEFYKQFQIVVKELQPAHFESRSAISSHWFEGHAYPREDRVEVFLRDITARKNAEESLKKQLHHLQRALLPGQIPTVDGYTMTHIYRPAFDASEIGGDFYDVFYTAEGKVGILIGDVAGKGIEYASLAANARATIRAFAYETSQPGASFARANSILSTEDGNGECFLTAFLVVLDPDTGEISYSSAGHPPAIFHRKDGGIEHLTQGNIPIAVIDNCDFDEFETTLNPGDKMLFYTDGVSETRRNKEFFGDTGICRIMEEHALSPTRPLLDCLLESILEWSDGICRDDTAMILIEREMDPQVHLF